MKEVYFLICFILVGTYNELQAQNRNSVFYNQYRNLANPADIQRESKHLISATIRNQWIADKDAPQTQMLLTTHQIGERIGLGASLINQKVFVQRQTGIYADFSYRLPLWSSNLHMGIKAGGDVFNIDANQLKTYNKEYDPYLQPISGKFQPNVGVGVLYQFSDFYVGMSVPNLLASEKTEIKDEVVTSVANQMYFYITGGALWKIHPDFLLKPMFQAQFSKRINPSYDITLAGVYLKNLELGLTYTTDNAASTYFLFRVPKYFIAVGYGYENNFESGLSNHLRNSHEFLLQFRW